MNSQLAVPIEKILATSLHHYIDMPVKGNVIQKMYENVNCPHRYFHRSATSYFNAVTIRL